MTKQPLPRYTTTLHITLDLSAADYEDADARLDKIADAIMAKLRKSTFQRLSGKPEATHIEWFDVEPA